MIYRYEAHVVTDLEYDGIRIGEPFRGGVLVDGLGGLGEDVLVITAHEVDEEVLLSQVPKSWCTKFFCGSVWAAHWNHPPRAISFAEAESTKFKDWPEVQPEKWGK